MKKIYLFFAISMYLFVQAPLAHADIFESPKAHKERIMASEVSQDDLNTILDTITAVSDRLGVREGFFYDFKHHEVLNYAAATAYTFEPYGIAIDFGALNLSGFAVTADYNLGRLIPPGDPLTNLLQYGYIGAGGGWRSIDGDGEAVYGITAQFKFTA